MIKKFSAFVITLILLCSCMSLGACATPPPVYDVQGNYILHPVYAMNYEETHNSPIRYYISVTSDANEENITVQFYKIDTSAETLVAVPFDDVVNLSLVGPGNDPNEYIYSGTSALSWSGTSGTVVNHYFEYIKNKNDMFNYYYDNDRSYEKAFKATSLTLEQYVAQLQANK